MRADEADADTPRYVEAPVARALGAFVACTWTAQFAAGGRAHVDRILPDGCIDVLWTDGELVVAGPDTRSVLVETSPGLRIVGLRFRAGVAPAAFGVPASALVDRRVDAADVLGPRARALRDELSRARSARSAAVVLEAHAARWMQSADERPDVVVATAIRALQRACRDDVGEPRLSLATLAARTGISERQLRRRFVDAMGYGPKTFARILRLRRFVAEAASPDPRRSLADLAATAGYADQSHLARECRDLAGCTPGELAGYPVTAA